MYVPRAGKTASQLLIIIIDNLESKLAMCPYLHKSYNKYLLGGNGIGI